MPVRDMPLKGRSGVYSSWLLSRVGGLGVHIKASLSEVDSRSLLARELGERAGIFRPVSQSRVIRIGGPGSRGEMP